MTRAKPAMKSLGAIPRIQTNSMTLTGRRRYWLSWPGADHLGEFEVVVAAADLREEDAHEGVVDHVGVGHPGDRLRAAELEHRVPEHPLDRGRHERRAEDLEEELHAVGGRVLKPVPQGCPAPLQRAQNSTRAWDGAGDDCPVHHGLSA